MIDKWTRKYMRMAKAAADDNDSCYSRKIGVALVSAENRLLSIGYNGSANGQPHTDTREYLTYLWTTLLTIEQRTELQRKYNLLGAGEFVAHFGGRKQCPRRILEVPSGFGLEYCNCAHAERNAFHNLNINGGGCTVGGTMYCWCTCPCHECSLSIMNAKIAKVVHLDEPLYHKHTPALLQMGGVEVVQVSKEELLQAFREKCDG